jgi:hypothetical protein
MPENEPSKNDFEKSKKLCACGKREKSHYWPIKTAEN